MSYVLRIQRMQGGWQFSSVVPDETYTIPDAALNTTTLLAVLSQIDDIRKEHALTLEKLNASG